MSSRERTVARARQSNVGDILGRAAARLRGKTTIICGDTTWTCGESDRGRDPVAQLDEGYITAVDREKDIIKTGGENVASREVEEAIYRHPDVSEVAVGGLPDPYWIEAVSAVVVVREGHALDGPGLTAQCREHLAGFKVPKRVFFAESLPKNPSGKRLKRDLHERYRNA